MLPMTHKRREKIEMYIKNDKDISSLIDNVSLTGESLKGARIKRFNRTKDNLSNCDFTNCVIGEQGRVNNLSGNNFSNSKFCDTVFLGTIFLRRCNCRNCDFSGANCINVEYQNTVFYGGKFCQTAIRIGTDYGMGARFSSDFFSDLEKGWNVEIKLKEGK
jgi:uncharacterized protein YjbI with pentapeptide repeats